MPSPLINNILVLDEMPTIALGLHELFRSLHNPVHTEHIENIFTALSSKDIEGRSFDLVVIGEQFGAPSGYLPPSIAELKDRFGPIRIMVYSPNYEPALLEKMKDAGINAYVHKYEPTGEIRKAWACLLAGEMYISPIFHTLFQEYRLGRNCP